MGKSERSRFGQFLDSSFFNQRQEVSQLGAYLLAVMEEHPRKLRKPVVWNALYPAQTYDDQKMRLVMSYTFKLLEQFLSLGHFMQDQCTVDRYLMQAYRKLDATKQFDRTWARAHKKLEQQAFRDYSYLHHQYELEQERHAYAGLEKQDNEIRLARLNTLLDQRFIYQKLKQACIYDTRNTILEEANAPRFLESIEAYLAENPESMELVGLQVYYQLYRLLKFPGGEVALDELQDLLRKSYAQFSTREMGSIFRLLINFGVSKMNKGQSEFIKKTFDLYREGIEQGFLLDNGILSAFSYINMIFIGMKLSVFKWVETFLEKYRSYLPPSERDNIYYFCLAHLRYEQDRLGDAMKLLVRFDAKHDFFLYLNAQTTLIKIYYQLKEFEPLESLLQRISVYLNRKANIGYRKEPYKKLVSVCRKMIYYNPNDRMRWKQLQEDADQIAIPSFRDWLLEQLDKLEK